MILALAMAWSWGGATIARAEGPPPAMAQIRSLGDRVLAVAKDPSCTTNREGCRDRLRVLIEQYWDTTDMARSALGYHWKALDDQQRQQFTKLFSDLIESDLPVAVQLLQGAEVHRYGIDRLHQGNSRRRRIQQNYNCRYA